MGGVVTTEHARHRREDWSRVREHQQRSERPMTMKGIRERSLTGMRVHAILLLRSARLYLATHIQHLARTQTGHKVVAPMYGRVDVRSRRCLLPILCDALREHPHIHVRSGCSLPLRACLPSFPAEHPASHPYAVESRLARCWSGSRKGYLGCSAPAATGGQSRREALGCQSTCAGRRRHVETRSTRIGSDCSDAQDERNECGSCGCHGIK
jgi:hypothetical protein